MSDGPRIKQKSIGEGEYSKSSTGVIFVIHGGSTENASRITKDLATKVEALVAELPEVELILPSNPEYWQLTLQMYEVVRG